MLKTKKMISFLSAAALALSVVPSAWATEDIPTATYGHGTLVPVGTADGTGDADWNFAVDGKKFTLLDVQNSATSKYYVIADEDSFGLYKNTSEDGVYDPTDESNLGYWVNTKLTDGEDSGDWQDPELPEKIVSAIDKNHQWVIEATDNTAIKTEQRSVTAGVTVPAVWELVKYADRIRWNRFSTAVTYLWTRTTRSTTDYYGVWTYANLVQNNQFEIYGVTSSKEYIVRPQFFLNENFFAKAAIDLENAGSEIIKIIEKVDYETLSNIYLDEDIMTYLPNVTIPNAVTVETTNKKAATVGNTLKVCGEKITADGATYQWYASGAEIDGATGKELALTFNELGKKIKCAVTVNGETYDSFEVTVTSAYPKKAIWDNGNGGWATIKTKDGKGNAAWNFTVGNREYTVADVQNNSKSRYYVIAKTGHGKYEYTSGDVNYDPTVEGSLAHYVNTTTKENLPEEFKDAIDNDHVWITEPGVKGTVVEKTIKAGVVIPASWEIQEYSDKINMVDMYPNFTTYIMLRTASTDSALTGLYTSNSSYPMVKDGTVQSWNAPTNSTMTIVLPQFFLNENFFKTTRLDLSKAGSEIIKLIEENTYADLSKIYTDAEIVTYLKNVDMSTAPEYSFNVDFAEKDGTAVDSINGMEEFKVNFTASNLTDASKNAIVIAALYDGETTLYKVETAAITIASSGTGSESVNFSGVDKTKTYTLKTFLWSSMSDMEPLTAAK